MTLAELIDECDKRKAMGLSKIMLVLGRPVGRGQRMRVFPGVMGEVACENSDGHAVVWCDIAAVENAIAKGRIR